MQKGDEMKQIYEVSAWGYIVPALIEAQTAKEAIDKAEKFAVETVQNKVCNNPFQEAVREVKYIGMTQDEYEKRCAVQSL
jgi:3-keto-L-gulonate-6-phosphate decarboxylase